MQNNGSGVFTIPNQKTYALNALGANPPTATFPDAIVAGSFNGNPKYNDIATVNLNTFNASILLNNADGSGTFPQGVPPVYGAGVGPEGLAAADFNRDGALDLVTADYFFNGFSILPGQTAANRIANATFGAATTYTPQGGNFSPSAVTTGLFDNNLFPDLAFVTYVPPPLIPNPPPGTSIVSVFLNKGNGTFGNAPDNTYNLPAGVQAVAIVAADVDGDGNTDLVTANANGSISILYGNGDGTFKPAVMLNVGQSPRAIAVADLNGDGKPDIVVADSQANTVDVLYGLGNRQFSAPSIYASGGTGPIALAIADFNGDKISDIAVANSGGTIGVILGNPGVKNATTSGSWTDLNTATLNTVQAEGVAQQPSNLGTLLEGSQDNGVALTANGANQQAVWNLVMGGDGGLVRFDPTNAAGGLNVAYIVLQNGDFRRSDNGGAVWAQKIAGLPAQANFPFYTVYAIDPLNTSRLIIGSNSQVFETTTRGDVPPNQNNGWTAISNVLDQNGVTAITYAPNNDQVVYVGFADGRVFTATNDQGNGQILQWTEVTAPAGDWPAGRCH